MKTKNNKDPKSKTYNAADWEWADGSHPNDYFKWARKQPDQNTEKFGKKEGDGEKKPFVKLDKKGTREKQKKDKSERRTKKLKEKGVELDVYNLGMEAKKIWEELRDEEKMKENEQKKVKLASELHALVKGNIKKIIFAR